jgi:hypothetical protein
MENTSLGTVPLDESGVVADNENNRQNSACMKG